MDRRYVTNHSVSCRTFWPIPSDQAEARSVAHLVPPAAEIATDRAGGVAYVRDQFRLRRPPLRNPLHRADHADRPGRDSTAIEDRCGDRRLADHGFLLLPGPAAGAD